jgi:excinuclease ABC subunit C
MPDILESIQRILNTLPSKPGCYIMKNSEGKVIYVGKAINLHNRVRSYYHACGDGREKVAQLIQEITDIDWILVSSELEALILEMTLIKKHMPHFNVRLKDDKRYPYIKVHWADPFPKVTVTRQMERDGSRYFGPYTSVWAVHQTLDLLRKIFQYRSCDRIITGQDARPCLYYDIKLCTAPCIGVIDQASYRQILDDLCKFLEGRTEAIIARLKNAMQASSEAMNYEKAAAIRDQILAIEKVVEKQKVVSSKDMDSDVIALARSDGEACVQVFFIRSGKLIGREYFILEGTSDEKTSAILSQFIGQYYDEASFVPKELLLPEDVEEAHIIQQWLRQKRGGEKVELKVPQRGSQRELVQMASENAMETLRALKTQWATDTHKQSEALAELQKALGLPQPPNRIECYDISNIQGTAAVGSMVVFEQGIPSKKHYRRFNIKTVEGADDFASMQEVLMRRFKRWQAAEELKKEPGAHSDLSFSLLPDLLIVDGGKGQLGRAVLVLKEFGLLEKVPAVGLAKEEEALFQPGKEKPLMLPRHSQGLYLLQRIRDEAHRFAITAHRNLRSKKGIASQLDSINGIGPARRKALIKKFGSVEKIRQVSVEELRELPGVTEEIARRIKENLA